MSTSVLRNESAWTLNNGAGLSNQFLQIGNRGSRGQSSTAGIDRGNVQFFTLIQQNAVGCWNSALPYSTDSVDIIAQDNTTLIFPNDLKLDHEFDQVSEIQQIWLYRSAFFFLQKRKKQQLNMQIYQSTGCLGAQQSSASLFVFAARL